MAPFRFLNPLYSERERFPKVLLYSAAVHLALFYLLFGDPISLLFQKRSDPLESRELRLHLLSPAQGEGGERGSGDKKDLLAFPRDKNGETSPSFEGSVLEEGIELVDAVAPSAVFAPAPRKIPRNMNGPEDCLLKVVAMVCPDADLQCIAEYKAFCSTLPE